MAEAEAEAEAGPSPAPHPSEPAGGSRAADASIVDELMSEHDDFRAEEELDDPYHERHRAGDVIVEDVAQTTATSAKSFLNGIPTERSSLTYRRSRASEVKEDLESVKYGRGSGMKEYEAHNESASGLVTSTASTSGKRSVAQEPKSVPGTSTKFHVRERKGHGVRYFIIKSLNHHNIAKSIENGIWATQQMNEPTLNEAFESSEKVILIFSVNMSGHFQGYAQMTSGIGHRRAHVWNEVAEGGSPWGGSFSVEWLRLCDLPFQMTVHLKNPLNYFKPVKISRDGQELTADIGAALCALIDEGVAEKDGLKRKSPATQLSTSDVSAKRMRGAFFGGSVDSIRLAVQPYFPGVHSLYHGMGARIHYENDYGVDEMVTRQGGNLHPRANPCNPRVASAGPCFDSSQLPRPRRAMAVRPPLLDRAREAGADSAAEWGGEGEAALGSQRGVNRRQQPDLNLPEEELLNMTYEEYLERMGRSRGHALHDQELGRLGEQEQSSDPDRGLSGTGPQSEDISSRRFGSDAGSRRLRARPKAGFMRIRSQAGEREGDYNRSPSYHKG